MEVTNLERALNAGSAPWREIEFKTKYFWVFKDKFPVSEGHMLFVPTEETFEHLFECYKAAYKFGYEGVATKKWDGFNIGQNVGVAAGQTVLYPHVHMIPRRKGDMEDPRGGVRHVIPTKGNYTNV
jgi:diadenosine tetraphosphate (Ap4A) HIT family hydrolase